MRKVILTLSAIIGLSIAYIYFNRNQQIDPIGYCTTKTLRDGSSPDGTIIEVARETETYLIIALTVPSGCLMPTEEDYRLYVKHYNEDIAPRLNPEIRQTPERHEIELFNPTLFTIFIGDGLEYPGQLVAYWQYPDKVAHPEDFIKRFRPAYTNYLGRNHWRSVLYSAASSLMPEYLLAIATIIPVDKLGEPITVRFSDDPASRVPSVLLSNPLGIVHEIRIPYYNEPTRRSQLTKALKGAGYEITSWNDQDLILGPYSDLITASQTLDKVKGLGITSARTVAKRPPGMIDTASFSFARSLVGTWILDESRSSFGSYPTPKEYQRTVSTDNGNITIATKQEGHDGRPLEYRIDGIERLDSAAQVTMWREAHWEDSTLVLSGRVLSNGTQATTTERWTMQNDSTTLSIDQTITSAGKTLRALITLVKGN